ncbi:prepilin-type N-terminal cleavage/methylation domain-containing protein [candidate division WWE3 bacterium]|nr:prepilin-type N-terminal cleavage/methylation domain-containing protein [candidate division WWE3 bacterium]
MRLPKNTKGFTLIELLVVIAVLGILAAVVLVAIDPRERINEANDAGAKNDVSQVATALESLYTNSNGSYTGATLAGLVSSGYLKRAPSGITITVNAGGTQAHISKQLNAASATCSVGTGTKYWVYRTATGLSAVECGTLSAP